jgi:hypothetical protein
VRFVSKGLRESTAFFLPYRYCYQDSKPGLQITVGHRTNVRLNLANVRAKVILIGHWSNHKKIVTLYIFLLWQNPIANSLNLHFAIKFARHSSILLNVVPEWLYILVS